MSPYLTEWLNLILRFAHVITGIAWIGASFYFIWLDNHLEKPPGGKIEQGIGGDLWAIHGGGFYEIAKYQVAPKNMPQLLHWFKWEAYSTWLTGFGLLSLMFYLGADIYLIDPAIARLSQTQAILIGLGVIVGGWVVYDLLCRSKLAQHALVLGFILTALALGLSYFLSQTFSARGAFIHMGAVIGTVMAGNVLFIIMPSQRALVSSVEQGKAVDPAWAAKAKLRSTHNTYLTLPVIFIMISNHYPMIVNHQYSWFVLMVILIITAAVRQYFVARHRGRQQVWVLVIATAMTIALAVIIAPKSVLGPSASKLKPVELTRVSEIITSRCRPCHSSHTTDNVFIDAQGGVTFDNLAQMSQWAPRIQARVIDIKDMPFMNKTKMTATERAYLAQWIGQGAPAQE
jgi:uncharacterized membrane protein